MTVADQHAYFDLSEYIDECTLLTEVIFVRDGNLSDEQLSKFLVFKNKSINTDFRIDPSGFASGWPFEESIMINLTSISGYTASHKIVFSFKTAHESKQKAIDLINSPPYIVSKLE